MKVLLVEDNTVTRESLGALLAAQGCEVHEACSVEEARAAVLESAPDRIFLDWFLPLSGDAAGFLPWLRSLPGCGRVPVVIATAASAAEVERIRRETAPYAPVGVLRKPFDPAEMIALLDGTNETP